MQTPPRVLQAMGTIIQHMIVAGYDVDGGCFLEGDLSIDEVDIGGWRLELHRTRKPTNGRNP